MYAWYMHLVVILNADTKEQDIKLSLQSMDLLMIHLRWETTIYATQ